MEAVRFINAQPSLFLRDGVSIHGDTVLDTLFVAQPHRRSRDDCALRHIVLTPTDESYQTFGQIATSNTPRSCTCSAKKANVPNSTVPCLPKGWSADEPHRNNKGQTDLSSPTISLRLSSRVTTCQIAGVMVLFIVSSAPVQ